MAGSRQQYKIKLGSGRILGPLDLERVRLLITKNKVTGNELAREYPKGEWIDINQIPAIAEIFLDRAQSSVINRPSESSPPQSGDATLPVIDAMAPTQVIASTEILSPGTAIQDVDPEAATVVQEPLRDKLKKLDLSLLMDGEKVELEQAEDHTLVDPRPAAKSGGMRELDGPNPNSGEIPELHGVEQAPLPDQEEDEATIVVTVPEEEPPARQGPVEFEIADLGARRSNPITRRIAEERTVVFQRSTQSGGGNLPGKKRLSLREKLVVGFTAIGLGYFGYEMLLQEKRPGPGSAIISRAQMPENSRGKSDPARSALLYDEAMKSYVQDTVIGYSAAAERLRQAVSLDGGNVKAISMLASCYLNLIDSLIKDENYFPVLAKLLELAKAKGVDLPELVIADVEFFVTVNKAEAAQSRIVEYTKLNPKFNLEMFYYLAYAFYHRGEFDNAARFINQIPENRAFSAKLFFLKGQIAEALGEPDAAIREYEKAVAFQKDHIKSRLQIADVMNRQGRLKESAKHLDYLVTRPYLLSPPDMARGFYLHGLLAELFQKWDIALADLERAVRLDKGKSDYLLELYILRGKAGDSPAAVAKPVRMYYFLAEGERRLKEGKIHEALTHYLQARKANDESPIPLLKIGDMFRSLNDLSNARMNYRMAAQRAPTNIDIWSKYMDVLIESYDWEEAQKAMDRFRKLPVSQSAIDKAAADMYAKQGRHVEAQAFYRQAMARESVAPDVFVAYAKSLMATQQFREAPFFFALALRYDPFNIDALIGTAKAVAATDSVDRGIEVLQDGLKRGNSAKAELLAAIAELHIQTGGWEQAQRFVDLARGANPDYAYPWKLQAQIHMNREHTDRKALDRALLAYQSYSDRNSSDPSGYLERYQIFIKKTQYENALGELQKIYAIYPKYPKLHYYRGALYSMMGNRKAAIDEFRTELEHHPNELQTILALGKELLLANAAEDALNYFSQAMSLSPTWGEAKHQAAYTNFVLKNYPAAVALYQAALQHDPANSLIYKRLGLAYREMGDQTSAAQSFRRYLEMEPDAPDRAQFQKYR